MISSLSQWLLELVERVRFGADWLSRALLGDTEHARELVDFVLANVHVLLLTVDGSSFKVVVGI